ncbi:MAG: STAS domain-containing protein [Desulfonatronovibrionaceae bacterium]
MAEGDGQIVLGLEKDIVAAESENVKTAIKEVMSDGMSSLVLDLDKVEQVDSVGMGVLIAAYNSLKKKDVEFKLINVSQNLYDLFQIMRLNKHFEIEVKE